MHLQGLIQDYLIGPLLLFLFTGWFLLLIWPRRSYPALLAFGMPLWVLGWWLCFRPLPSGDDWGWLGQSLIVLALGATLLSALVRFLVSSFLENRRVEPMPPLDWTRARQSALAIGIGAAIFAASPIVAHTFGAVAALAALVAIVVLAVGYTAYRRRRGNPWGYEAVVATVTALGCALVLIWPVLVMQSAEQAASGRDYCILVADGGSRNREAASILELSPLVMRASERNGRAVNRHGYIVFGTHPSMHWSYLQGRFESKPTPTMGDDMLLPDTRCTPKREFAAHLPML